MVRITSRSGRCAAIAVTAAVALTAMAAAPAEASTTEMAPAYSAQEFWQDYHDALQVVNGYWTNHWSESFTGSYTAPQLLALPDRPEGIYVGNVDTVACNGTPGPADNAFYCPVGDFVAFDVGFLYENAEQHGDVFPYLIVAHEWGHAIQARLRADLRSPEAELQADCFAGAALQGAVDDGTFELQDTDTQEFQDSLVAIADPSPWTQAGDHGDPEQRVASFRIGASQGPLGCLG